MPLQHYLSRCHGWSARALHTHAGLAFDLGWVTRQWNVCDDSVVASVHYSCKTACATHKSKRTTVLSRCSDKSKVRDFMQANRHCRFVCLLLDVRVCVLCVRRVTLKHVIHVMVLNMNTSAHTSCTRTRKISPCTCHRYPACSSCCFQCYLSSQQFHNKQMQ